MENEIPDGDLDPDEDGLTLLEEFKLGTDPLKADTDNDKLSDYDEINVYHTLPLNPDTDGDTVLDGDEIAIGLDPNDPETFGYPDKNYVYTVKVDSNSDKLKKISKNDYVFDFEVKGNGNILSDLYVRKSNLVQSIDTDYVIGDIPEIIYEGGDIDSITLNFEINENNIFENPVAPELSGVNGFAVFMYDAEEGMLVPVDTVYDEENNKISATVDKPGSYAVVDLYTWAEYISDMLEMFEEGEPEEADIEAEGSNETMIQEEEFDVIAESDETVAEATEYDETIAEAEGDDDLSEEKTLFMVPQILKTAPAPSKIDSSTPLDFVIIYHSYCSETSHVWGKKDVNCPKYQRSLYTIAQFAGTVAHEFGHVMGLKDLYATAYCNHDYTIIDNAEVYKNGGTFAMPNAGSMMGRNGHGTDNDIEMVIFAFSENTWQYYVPWETSQSASEAIRCPASYSLEGSSTTFTWDEGSHSFV